MCSVGHGLSHWRMEPHCRHQVSKWGKKLAMGHLGNWGRDVDTLGVIQTLAADSAGLWVLVVSLTWYMNLAKPLFFLGLIFPDLKIRSWTGLSSCFIPYNFCLFLRHNSSLLSASFHLLDWKDVVNGKLGVKCRTQIFFYSSFIKCVKIYPTLSLPKDCCFRNMGLIKKIQKVQLQGHVRTHQLAIRKHHI